MRKFLLLSIISIISIAGFSQDFSNKGKDFYLCFPSHVPNAIPGGLPILSIYITSDAASTGTITMSNGAFSAVFNLNAGNNYYQEIQITSATAQVLNAESNTIVKKSIRVKTDPGQPAVVVYAEQWAGARSAATLVLPVNVLGKKYYAVSANQDGSSNGSYLSKSHFQIIAINDNTVVQITPKYNGLKQASFTITLPLAGDMYQYEPASQTDDITGSYIESLASGTGGCLPIAVFSGTSNVRMGVQGCGSAINSYDPLWQQVYPVGTWGKNFGFVPFANYPNGSPYRVIASVDNTNVYFDGSLVATLNAGGIYPNTFVTNPPALTAPTYITADQPISVTQYLPSNGCSGAGSSQGDPDMVILNPIEQNIKDITVFSSSQQAITQRFVNVLIKTNAIASFQINGASPTTAWQTFASLPGYSYLKGEPFPGTGSYHLVADSGFNAIAYGYGANESYAYSAGTNVKDLNQQLQVGTQYGIESTPSLCVGELFKFKAYFSVPPSGTYDSIRWNCTSPALVVNNLPITYVGTYDSTNIQNGNPVLWYSLPQQYSFNAPGSYTATITTYKSTTEGCGNATDYDFTIQVFDPPTPTYSYTLPGCYLQPVQFTETTPQLPKPTYAWYWNFGDVGSGAANTSTQRNPMHTFSAPGTYTVKYVGITTTGCLTDTVTQQVVVPNVPNATISGTASVCINATPAPVITVTITGGVPPYQLDYRINNIPQPSIISPTGIYNIIVPTNVATTFTYQLDSVKNQGSTLCKSIINGQTATVTVNPDATLTYQSGPITQTVCINTAISAIKYLVGSGGTGAIVTGLPAGVTGTFAGGIFTISGTPTVSGTFNYSIIPDGPCKDPAFPPLTGTIIVSANATLSLQSASPDRTVCANNAIAPIDYLVGGGATGATVTFTPALPGVTGTYNAATQIFTIQGTPAVAGGSYTYTVNTVSTCINAPPLGGTITVNPDATINLTSGVPTTNQTVCINNGIAEIDYNISGSVTSVIVSNLPPGVTYTYTPGAPGTLKITGIPTTANSYTYSIAITGPCQVPAAQTGTINVTPNATISLQSGTASPTICVNNVMPAITYSINGSVTSAILTGPLPPGVTYTYVPGNPGSLTIQGTPTSSVGSPFNYSISLTGPCLVPPPATGSITVTPDATVSLSTAPSTKNQTVCVNTPINTIKWTAGGSATAVNVSGLPAGVTGAIAGNVVTITGAPTTVSATPQTYTYHITTLGPCVNPDSTGTITVNPDHTLSAPANASQTVCLNAPIAPVIYTFGGGATGVTIIGLPAGLTYTIVGSTVTITGSPAASGTYNIITSGNACVKAQGSGTITVTPLPAANFNYSTPSCDTRVITFTDNSVPNAGVLTGWSWNFGDGSPLGSGTPIAHLFPGTGTYNVTLIVSSSSGCSNATTPFTIPVTITARPHADFTLPVVCVSDIASFTDISTGGTANNADYKWDFGDPASGAANIQFVKNGTHQFSAAGIFTVTHIVTSAAGCTDTITHNILISSAPVANFSVTNAAALCVNDSVAIVNLSTIAVGNITKVEIYWDNVGAPATFIVDNAPVLNAVYKHKYLNFQAPLTRPYTIRFRAYTAGSCVTDKLTTITLNAVPKVQFNAMPDACYDAAPFQITQASEIGGVPGTGVYSGPGVSPAGLFNPVTAGVGTHTIKYTFTSSAAGCVDTMSSTINVLDTARALFSHLTPLCDGTAATFMEVSTAPAGVILNNTIWNLGDGSPLQSHAPGASFTHSYATWGTYNVTMYNTSAYGCKSTTTMQQVVVNPIPQPVFAFKENSVCLPNAAVSFINNSTIADASAMTYAWDFGDLKTSTAQTPPAHIYTGPGPYIVKLIATSDSGCSNVVTHTVDFIHPQPIAAFDLSKPEVCIGGDVIVTDKTDGLDGTVVEWHWGFGDGITATTPQVQHLYTTAQTYNIELYVVNSHGCTSTVQTQQFRVNPYPIVSAGPDAIVLEGGSYTMQPVISNSTSYQYLWSPATYLTSTTDATPTAAIILNDITYTLTVTGTGGCTAPSDKMFIKVLKAPKIPNTFTPNGDGINETWIIEYLDTYPNCKVQVFTRTGQLVFESRGYKTPWDGKLNGKPLPFDTYYYIIEPGNGRAPITGYVTIVK